MRVTYTHPPHTTPYSIPYICTTHTTHTTHHTHTMPCSTHTNHTTHTYIPHTRTPICICKQIADTCPGLAVRACLQSEPGPGTGLEVDFLIFLPREPARFPGPAGVLLYGRWGVWTREPPDSASHQMSSCLSHRPLFGPGCPPRRPLLFVLPSCSTSLTFPCGPPLPLGPVNTCSFPRSPPPSYFLYGWLTALVTWKVESF